MEDEECGLVVPVQELNVQNVLHAVVRNNLYKRIIFSSSVYTGKSCASVRYEDPVLANNRIRGSVPQTKGDFLKSIE